MELPVNRVKNTYITAINSLQADLRSLVETNPLNKVEKLRILQVKLDKLADTYQNNESLGESRYKLYDTQAFIFHMQGKDDEALEFINQAIQTRGESYEKADRLIAKLHSKKTNTTTHRELSKDEKRKKLIGLEGWLALYVVGLVITALVAIYSLITYSEIFDDLEIIRNNSYEMYQSFTPVLGFEILYQIIMVLLITVLVIQLARHKKAAKPLAITYMSLLLLCTIVDYALVSELALSYNLDMQAELTDQAGAVGRNFIYLAVWLPYFLVSKRVKATLTK